MLAAFLKSAIGPWLLKNADSTAIQKFNYNYYPLLSSQKEDSRFDPRQNRLAKY
jgi:hypothetical protein